MKKAKRLAVLVTAVIFGVFLAPLAAQQNSQPAASGGQSEKLPSANAEKIRTHDRYLSSDELEGRGMGQPGGEKAADYIGKEFASYGLQPAGDNGTFFQSVPMVAVKT